MATAWFMVEVRVTGWRRSVAWYREVLALRVVLDDPDHEFALLEAGRGGGRVAIKGGWNGEGNGRNAVRLVFEVEDLDRIGAELVERGLEVEGPIASAEGYREIRIVDPDGTPIGLFAWDETTEPDRP